MRKEKQFLYDAIEEKLNQSEALIVTKHDRLSPEISWKFRELLRKNGAELEVVKKRIFHKVAKDQKMQISLDQLEGHVALVFTGSDPIESTKSIFSFVKENGNVFTVLYGKMEGKEYTAAEVEQLSKLPGKEEMRASFLGLLEAPLSQTVATMEAVLTSVPFCLENKNQQKSS